MSGYVPTGKHDTSFCNRRGEDKLYLPTCPMRLRSPYGTMKDGAPAPGGPNGDDLKFRRVVK